MKRKRLQESDSPLESLRITYTDLSQAEFAVRCGFALATYQRMIAKNNYKFTLDQIIGVCRICNISLKTFFERLGADLTAIALDQ